jgi:hypothetical protein
MRKILAALIVLFSCAATGAQVINNPLTANLTAQSTDCSVANSCAWQLLTLNAATSVVTLSGTFSGTFLVEQTNNGTTFTTAATLNSTGTTTYSSNGYTAIRVRCSAYTSGTAVVALSTGTIGGTGSTTTTIASGTAALGTTLITNGTCAAVVTVTAPLVLTTDNVAADFNADPTSTTGYNPATGLLSIVKWPGSGNVNFKVCNATGSNQTPGAVTLNWRVTR